MLGIVVSKLCDVIWAEDIRQTVEKGSTACVRAVGVINREKKAIMKAGLSVPIPACDGQKEAQFTGKAGIIGLVNRLRGRRWVKVDGNSEMSGGLKDREEARIVKKKTTGGAIYESAVKSKACDTALQLSGCRGGCLHGKSDKTAKTFGMGTHPIGELVIDVAG